MLFSALHLGQFMIPFYPIIFGHSLAMGVSKLSGVDEMENMSRIMGIRSFLKLALIVTMHKKFDCIP
jgi:hypothetical protein